MIKYNLKKLQCLCLTKNRAFCHHETMSTRTRERELDFALTEILDSKTNLGKEEQNFSQQLLASVRSGKLHCRLRSYICTSEQQDYILTKEIKILKGKHQTIQFKILLVITLVRVASKEIQPHPYPPNVFCPNI